MSMPLRRVISNAVKNNNYKKTLSRHLVSKNIGITSASAFRVKQPFCHRVQPLSTQSTFTPELEKFTNLFLDEVKGVPHATDPAASSKILRQLCKTELLKFTDMRNNPQKFFLAHRLLSTIGLGGFGIRFTVQFNLFAGSLVGLAGEEQLKMLDDIQKEGKLGCFLLTEMQAGVLSGLIVETTVDWDTKNEEFVLNTPSDKAAKNWISQGFVADCGVIIANLRIDGKSYGPHAFYMDLRDDNKNLLPGIRIEDMGVKTIANDLDNARVWFDNVRLPRNALLNKFADIDENNQYVQVTNERMRIEVIGQRLLTGRIAIAEAALFSARVLHMKTEEYANHKICNGLTGETPLSTMPQLKHVLKTSYAKIDKMIAFTAAVENDLNECLLNDRIPDEELVEKIAVCKIKCIEVAIECAHALQLEVGSYALMHDTGFELFDMLLCCKFAEGDSRILQQKLARDRLKRVRDDGVVNTIMDFSNESFSALKLANKMKSAGRDLEKISRTLDENWEDVYDLANQICERHIKNTPGRAFVEPCVNRLQGADFDFDSDWKTKV